MLGSDTDIGELASVLEEMGLTPEELQALQDENEILTMVAQMDFADQMNREQNMGEVKNLPNTDTAPPLALPPARTPPTPPLPPPLPPPPLPLPPCDIGAHAISAIPAGIRRGTKSDSAHRRSSRAH